MGHPQPATPLQAYNSTSEGIVNITIFQKCSKAIDMHFYWMRDQEKLKILSSLLGTRIKKSMGLAHKTPPGIASLHRT